MSKKWRVWVEVELIDEDNDVYDTIEGHSIDDYDTEEAALKAALKVVADYTPED